MPEQNIPEFDHFDYEDAWRLGNILVNRARAENLPVTMTIWLGEQRVFHAARPGTRADDDNWTDKKARTVLHWNESTMWVYENKVAETAEKRDDPNAYKNFFATFGLSSAVYAPAPGGLPIRVRGSLVGVVAISGVVSEEDHNFALQGLIELSRDGG